MPSDSSYLSARMNQNAKPPVLCAGVRAASAMFAESGSTGVALRGLDALIAATADNAADVERWVEIAARAGVLYDVLQKKDPKIDRWAKDPREELRAVFAKPDEKALDY